jgi:hypothetical protein
VEQDRPTRTLNLKAGWNAVVLTFNTDFAEGAASNTTFTSPITLPASVF